MQSEADVKRDADIGVDRSGPAEAMDREREKFQFYSGLKNRRPYSVSMKNHPKSPEDPRSIEDHHQYAEAFSLVGNRNQKSITLSN